MNEHLTSPNFLTFTVLVVGFMAFTGYTWLRLDSLCDRAALASTGSRVRRALVRQIGAMVGWWLIAASVLMWSFYSATEVVMPLLVIGVGLVAMAVISRRRGDAPLFWGAV